MKANPLNIITTQLSPSQRWNIRLTRLLYGLVLAVVTSHVEALSYILPVIVLPLAVFSAAKTATRWHSSRYPAGCTKRNANYVPLYRNAAIAGAALSLALFLLPAIVPDFLTYVVNVVGAIFLISFFFTKGFVAGWNVVVDQDAPMPVTARGVPAMNVVFALFSLSLALTVTSFGTDILNASSAQSSSSQTCDSLCQAMSGNSSDSQ